jgi:hypothetical protein
MSRAVRRQSFKTPNREPILFDINGDEFECRSQIPGFVLLDLMQALDSDSDSMQVQGFKDLFAASMETEEHERFVKYVNEPSSNVGPDTLIDLGKWLAGEYVKRPTTPPVGSARGRSKTRTTSKAD